MSMIKRNLQTLNQFNFKERIILIAILLLEKIIENKRDDLFRIKKIIESIYKNGGTSKRQKNKNILTVNNNCDIDAYKISVRRNGSDFSIYREIFFCNGYKALVDVIDSGIGRQNIQYIIDAGANIGCATIYLKNKFPDSMIVAIEPEEQNYKMLLENIQLNRFRNIFPLNHGLWFNNSNLEIDDSRKRADRFITKQNTTLSSRIIKGITIDGVMKKYSMPWIDILKIDIEGAEIPIFENEERVRSFLPLVKYIAIEIHDKSQKRNNILKLFEKFGFDFFDYREIVVAYNRNIPSPCCQNKKEI